MTMNIEYVKRIHFQYRELMVERLGEISQKQCYLELFKYLHTNGIPYYIQEAGVLFTLKDLDQRVVYKIDKIISKYAQPDHK